MNDLRRMTAAETKAELLDRVRTEGVATAFDTALAVLRDPKAAAPAKATIVTTMFRVAGYLKDGSGDGEIDISKMTRAELESFLSAAKPELERLEKSIADRRLQLDSAVIIGDEPEDVFG